MRVDAYNFFRVITKPLHPRILRPARTQRGAGRVQHLTRMLHQSASGSSVAEGKEGYKIECLETANRLLPAGRLQALTVFRLCVRP